MSRMSNHIQHGNKYWGKWISPFTSRKISFRPNQTIMDDCMPGIDKIIHTFMHRFHWRVCWPNGIRVRDLAFSIFSISPLLLTIPVGLLRRPIRDA